MTPDIRCPHCNAKLEGSAATRGARTRCPQCNESFLVDSGANDELAYQESPNTAYKWNDTTFWITAWNEFRQYCRNHAPLALTQHKTLCRAVNYIWSVYAISTLIGICVGWLLGTNTDIGFLFVMIVGMTPLTLILGLIFGIVFAIFRGYGYLATTHRKWVEHFDTRKRPEWDIFVMTTTCAFWLIVHILAPISQMLTCVVMIIRAVVG
jgi:phage FluMu protein Com